jgi:agmatine deiminase
VLSPNVEVVEAAYDDSWFRDNGPTFLTGPDGQLGAVHWTFNAWGQKAGASWDLDAQLGRFAAERAGATVFTSSMVNEGGGIHVDGEGTVLVTDTVQLHHLRNPDWSRAEVEAELRSMLGVTTVIWMARGLTADMQGYGTNGHVDIMCSFVRPGLVVAHRQPDPTHPDHDVMADNLARLRATPDARGRTIEVIEIEAPETTWHDGVPNDHSYINFVFANGGLVVCSFGDDRTDAAAVATFAELMPERRILTVDARPIFDRGGGIHCITQQEPLA